MSFRVVAERVVADFQSRDLPAPTRRAGCLPRIPGKASAVVGMRRVGKTWRLFQDLQDRLAAGTPRERILYVNFEDERLGELSAEDLSELTNALYRRHPAARDEGIVLYLDEVQNVAGWERFVRRTLDGGGTDIAVTGSSARLLSHELATSLRGRSLVTELLPFSYAESLLHAGLEPPAAWPPPAAMRYRLEAGFTDYLSRGGFPEVQSLSSHLQTRVLQDYVDVVTLRDIVERHGVTNVSALRYLIRRLLDAPAGRFSVHRIYNDMRSQQRSVSKDTLYAMLDHLQDASLVFPVSIDSPSERVRAANPRKIYPIDTGLARAHSYAAAADTGHLLETAVYLQLRRDGYECAYVQTAAGNAVDFIARAPHRKTPRLVQVCADLASPETRTRELRALTEAMTDQGLKEAEIVTLFDEEPIQTPAGQIAAVPAWRWFLDPAWR